MQKKLRTSSVQKNYDELTFSHKMQYKMVKICFQVGKVQPVNPTSGFIETLFCG